MTTSEKIISPERWIVSILIVALAAPIAGTAAAAFGVRFLFGAPAALVLGLLSCRGIARRLPEEWDGARRTHRAWSVLFFVVAVCAVARTTGVAWFMADPSHPQSAMYSFDWFYTQHSCYSGIWRAGEMARAGDPNLYDTSHYTGKIGRFDVDEFLYLPQFVLLPRTALALGGNFYTGRSAWFALEAALFATAAFGLCIWLGGAPGRRVALFLPALWVSSPILATLQIGNFQLAAIALSILAMISFERGWHALGGAFLAVAVCKLFPGVLVVYLAVTKRWRAAAWTIAFSLVFCGVALVWLGVHPFQAFLHYDVPRLVSGRAWSFLEDPDVSNINDSVPGLILKLRMLGMKSMTLAVENAVGWLWTVVVLILTVLAGRRNSQMPRLQRICCWLALLTVASYRARFVPDIYGLDAPIWLWTFIAASLPLTWRNKTWMALAWVALDAVMLFDGPITGSARLILSTTSQFVAIGLCLSVRLGYFWRSEATERSAYPTVRLASASQSVGAAGD